MGPLEPLRRLEVFRAPRTAPMLLLLELGTLRLLFVSCYVALAAALFGAFGIEVGAIRSPSRALMLVVSVLRSQRADSARAQIVFVSSSPRARTPPPSCSPPASSSRSG